MRRENINRIINKTSHWPLAKRREYLIAALECEKQRRRRGAIRAALCEITTRVLKQEMRGRA